MCTCFLKFSGNDCVWTTDRVADVLVLRQQQRRLVSVRRLGWYGQISFPKLMSSFSGPTFLVGRESLESACGFFLVEQMRIQTPHNMLSHCLPLTVSQSVLQWNIWSVDTWQCLEHGIVRTHYLVYQRNGHLQMIFFVPKFWICVDDPMIRHFFSMSMPAKIGQHRFFFVKPSSFRCHGGWVVRLATVGQLQALQSDWGRWVSWSWLQWKTRRGIIANYVYDVWRYWAKRPHFLM